MWRAFSLLLFFACIPVVALAAEPMGVVKGTIQTTSLCGAGTALMLAEQSTQLIIGTSTVVYGPAAGPAPGIVVFTVTVGTTTCTVPNTASTITGQRVSHIVYASAALPSTPGGGSGEGSGSGSAGQSLSDRIQSAAQQAQSYLQQFLNPPPPATPSVTTSPGIPFGGPIMRILFCQNAAIFTVLGPPTPGPYVWMPGTISYPYGPPAYVGQYLLGASGPGGVCIIGNTVYLGQRIIMHGSSGPIAPSAPEAPPAAPPTQAPTSCTGATYPNTAAGRRAAETAARDKLSACGIGVNKSACPFNTSFRDVPGGCTDVGGLQCGTADYLCDLSRKCGAGSVFITGGSETGHKGTGSGKAFDLRQTAKLTECLNDPTKFTKSGRGYIDRTTGAAVLDESTGDYNQTGANYHFCVDGIRNGKYCSH